MAILAPEEGLLERIRWLIRLRWIATAGVVVTVVFVVRVAGVSVPVLPACTVACVLALYNLLLLLYLKFGTRNKAVRLHPLTTRIANVQISLDLLCLTALLHFSGGVENPFVFYFIFHMIIASILLSRRASYLQATFATVLFLSMVTLERFDLLRHYCLIGFVTQDLHANELYIGGVSFVFVSTLYLAVYMATSISVKLRLREEGLREANLLLEEKDRVKSEYVLRVTHDIKQHLSAIVSCLEPVMLGVGGELNPGQKDLTARAHRRAEALLFFVRALLDITSIKLKKEIDMGPFSLGKTVENAINFVEARANDKKISISHSIDPGVDILRGTQVYIEETIANLLANSVKYTPENGSISVSVRDSGDFVLIQISDTGIGIPEAEIPRIFEEFYRASNAREVERTGTGLGLSFAKEVVERHGGKIWVESQLGKGSTFHIQLPK